MAGPALWLAENASPEHEPVLYEPGGIKFFPSCFHSTQYLSIGWVGVSLSRVDRQLLCALTALSLPNMFAARARHSIGRFLLSQLLFADWAGFSHHVRHTLTSHLG